MNLNEHDPKKIGQGKPWASREEQLVDVALTQALSGTPEQIRAMRPIAAPQNPFPDRLGFRQQAWTIEEVFNIDRYTPTYRSWLSGMPVRPSIMSDQAWSGTARNSMTEGAW